MRQPIDEFTVNFVVMLAGLEQDDERMTALAKAGCPALPFVALGR
ncbi:MAG: hypothetical protein QME79_12320 [Bacillota bacterium]|nr:hypothetical protein [Bacillota bacterium]